MGEPVAEPVATIPSNLVAGLNGGIKSPSREHTPTPVILTPTTTLVPPASTIPWPATTAVDVADDNHSQDSDRPAKRARVNSEGDVSMQGQVSIAFIHERHRDGMKLMLFASLSHPLLHHPLRI